MIGRRDFALLAASGAALAAGERAYAQPFAGFERNYRLRGVGRTTLSREPFDADGVPGKPLWQAHSSGESLLQFFRNGTGKARGTCVTQIGAVFDPSLQNDTSLLAAQEARFAYEFRYALGASGAVKLYIAPGSYVREALKGPRKGLVRTIAFAEADKVPAFVGQFSGDGKHLSLQHPAASYTRHADRNGVAPESFGAKQATMHGYLQT